MPPVTKPKLVNRGGAGLLTKLTPEQKAGIKQVKVDKPILTKSVAKHRIAPGLQGMEIDINALEFDPNNARLHPEKNKEAIIASLRLYGQVKPIVVNRSTNIVIAGNGTLEAARTLGWETIAVSYVDMSEVEAAGYGLADNRTSELAKWDMEVVARLDKLLQEFGHETVGWSADELEVLRAAEWVPVAVEEGGVFKGEKEEDARKFEFDDDEMASLSPIITHMRTIQNNEHMSKEALMRLICEEWYKAERCGRLEGLDDEQIPEVAEEE